MKRILSTATVLAILMVLVPTGSGSPRASARLNEVPLAWQVQGGSMLSEPIEEPATLVGLTWEDETPESAWFRVEDGGKWGPWIRLGLEDEHGPDPETPEAANSRPGSDLVWVGPVDGVQYRIEGGTADVNAVVIDTEDRRNPLEQRFENLFTDPSAQAAPVYALPGRPAIRPRSAWDPTNSCTPRAQPSYAQITLAFVHHTTGTNSYTASQVPSRILGICLFHLNSRGWDDIGYNFLIDRFGVIWEGRAGGIDKGVQGAHTAGFNSYSFGVAFIGDHSTSAPTTAAQNALVSLLAWKFGVHNVNPSGFNTVVSKGSAKWPEGRPVAFYPVSSHRDGQATSCPGDACLRRLPTIRSRVDSIWNQIPLSTYRNPLVGDFDGDDQLEAAVYRPANGTWYLTETNGSTAARATFSTKSGWSTQAVGDFNGDGRDDIANYFPGNGTWWVARSTGSGFTTTQWAKFSTRSGWSSQVVGDFNGDDRDDIANYFPGNGTWWVALSTGSGFTTTQWAKFSARTGWSKHVVGDFDGDGRDDIANFHPANGTWWVAESRGNRFNTRLWADFSTASGWTHQIVGDFNEDGREDIANHHPANDSWWVSRSTGSRFSTTQWGVAGTLDHISAAWAQDVNSDGRTDLVAFDAYNGFLRRHLSTGSGFNIQTLADTPWRTTLSASNNGDLRGSSGWVFFGQEFGWVRLTGMNQSAAGASLVAPLPRG